MLGNASLFEPLLSIFPLWLVGLILIALCLLAREGGAWLYRRLERRLHEEAKVEGDTDSQITGAIFGLLAFVLAFTFSIALDRYDTRRGLVVEEANAIGTAYRRASLFDEPARTRLQTTLREYVHTRVAPSGLWDKQMEARIRQSRVLRERFWAEAHDAILPVRATELGSYFVESANQVIETGTSREAAGRAHVPSRILDVMMLYLLISIAMTGYLLRGRKGARRQASTVLIVLFVIVIVLILDLDQPRAGTIQVSQRALEDMGASLDADAANRPGAPIVGPR